MLNPRRTAVLSAWLLSAGLLMALLLTALDARYPPDLTRVGQTSVQVLDRDDRLLRGFLAGDGRWRLPLRADQVDPLYLRLLLNFEDRRFRRHPGVDPLALGRALWQWLRAGKAVSGASTLTMQTARLLHPRPRTLSGKFVEMLRALQLEWRYGKTRILGFYLTLAPFGGNLEGVRAATLAYFGKEPRHLTPAEAALLVALPQAPSRLRPDRFPARARAARDKVLARMVERGVLSAGQAAEARRDPVPSQRRALPFLAPHLARRLRAAAPGRGLHRTAIDGGLQRTLEALARRRAESESDGLDVDASLALLVVDNRDRRVLAYVGGADFFATRRAGQVDLVRAVRSPGSTLKPLIYALAFDRRVVHPETLIDDVPTRFGNYTPSNFRNVYQGQVSAREALQQSLNVPAVAVLEALGPLTLTVALRDVGLPLHWRREQAPGLPLALGGVGATLEALVTLYAAFADGGRVRPLRFDNAVAAASTAPALFGEEAAGWLWQILSAAPPPPGSVPAGNRREARPLAYKTGTSYGFRDAWALGYDRAYTVGVWVGRPDATPSPGRYGRNTAAPLLFRVFDLLPAGGPVAGAATLARNPPPARLRHFAARRPERPEAALRIGFPPDGARLAVNRDRRLPLIASGGRPPLYWLINGAPLTSPARRGGRRAFWRPDGAGQARITVLDAGGRSASATVWIE